MNGSDIDRIISLIQDGRKMYYKLLALDLAEISLEELLHLYIHIPTIVGASLHHWLRLDDCHPDQVVDTNRYLYVNENHLTSLNRIQHSRLYMYRARAYWLSHWLGESVLTDDAWEKYQERPEALIQKPPAESALAAKRMCEALYERYIDLRRCFGSARNLWFLYEFSLYANGQLTQLNGTAPKGKDENHQVGQNIIRHIEALVSEYRTKVYVDAQKSQSWKHTDEVQKIDQTYECLCLPMWMVKSYAVESAQRDDDFNKNFFRPWQKKRRAENNFYRRGNKKIGISSQMLQLVSFTMDGKLTVSQKSKQIKNTRKRNSKGT